jgi:hypothetical protein
MIPRRLIASGSFSRLASISPSVLFLGTADAIVHQDRRAASGTSVDGTSQQRSGEAPRTYLHCEQMAARRPQSSLLSHPKHCRSLHGRPRGIPLCHVSCPMPKPPALVSSPSRFPQMWRLTSCGEHREPSPTFSMLMWRFVRGVFAGGRLPRERADAPPARDAEGWRPRSATVCVPEGFARPAIGLHGHELMV